MKKNSSPLHERKKTSSYVFDTSAIIAFVEICGLNDALQKFSKKVNLLVPIQVRDEFLNGCQSAEDIAKFEKTFSTCSVNLKKELLPYFNFDSECGEIQVISYAIENPGCWCVIDEEYGRKICSLFKVKLAGTIGIISKLKKLGYLTETDIVQVKKLLESSNFYLSKKLLNEFL
jgi:predicted nucleic acid-binding protein